MVLGQILTVAALTHLAGIGWDLRLVNRSIRCGICFSLQYAPLESGTMHVSQTFHRTPRPGYVTESRVVLCAPLPVVTWIHPVDQFHEHSNYIFPLVDSHPIVYHTRPNQC